MRALICYLSYSGNTKETAEAIEHECLAAGMAVDCIDILANTQIINPEHYDVFFLGTFTFGRGGTPDEMKDFILDIGYKPKHMAIFGTGDTQFGGDRLFCLAAKKLKTFYNSPWEALKIEQTPRGSQLTTIARWTKEIINDVRCAAKKGHRIRTQAPEQINQPV